MANREAITRLHDLEERIARTRALTREGKLLKARMAVAEAYGLAALEEMMEASVDPHSSVRHFIGLSLVLDILQESGTDA
jgi:hypothetical protein